MKFKQKLTAGFQVMRLRGYFAEETLNGKPGWWCCQSCGVAALPKGTTNYIFYHEQDAERMIQDKSVYLCWGGDGEEIRKTFLEAGLGVIWDGSPDTRIYVYEDVERQQQ